MKRAAKKNSPDHPEPIDGFKWGQNMENNFKSAVASLAALTALTVTGVARADDGRDVKALKAEAAALKRQNAELEKRLNKLERQQAAQAARPAQQGAASADFVASAATAPVDFLNGDGPLTWNGITFFGNFNEGLGWSSHGLPLNGQTQVPNSLITKNLNHAYFGLSPNGLQNSALGLKGAFPLNSDLAGVFMASTGINPQSGQLSNSLGAMVANNGLSRAAYSANGDGSRAGQAFNDELYAGVSSKTFGELVVGRNRTLTNNLVTAYDPMAQANAFSPIGYSGIPASGLGDTENSRWDDSVKYQVRYGLARFGAMYKFADGGAGCNYVGTLSAPKGETQSCFTPHNDAGQVDLGFSYANFDFDGALGYFNQAVSSSPLSAAQLGGTSTFTPNIGAAVTSTGANANTLSGVISDNTGWALGAKYTWNQFKFYAGWGHVIYHNPSDNLGVGAQADQGGYILSSVNNAAYPNARLLDTVWTGVGYAYDPKTVIAVAYYIENQNTYGNAAQQTTCGRAVQSSRSSTCSGQLHAVSALVDYHLTKRFDLYGGMMVSTLSGGFAGGSGSATTITNGALYYTNWAPTIGARFTF